MSGPVSPVLRPGDAMADDPLARPLSLAHGPEIPNRFAKSAMSEQLAAPDGGPGSGILRLYERWGAGGAGLLLTGNVMVDRRALGEPGNVVVEDDRHLARLTRWAAAAQARGARLWMQVNHPGRQSPRTLSPEPVAPSAVPLEGMGGAFAAPRALEEREIHEIVRRFAATAEVAKRAGFAGVQIHAAHGYLVSQFLSPRTNRRTDAWGGSPERRRRFLLEVVQATRAAVGTEVSVGVKLNSADFQRGGITEEETVEVVRALDDGSVDLLEISGGTYERPEMWRAPARRSTFEREAYFLDFAERVRGVATMPLMLTGGMRTRVGMVAALSGGAIDLVGLARPLAVEPDLPARLLSRRADAARRIDLSVGVRAIDAMIEACWYQFQIGRMGCGSSPRPGASRLAALHTIVKSLPRIGTRRG